MLTVSDRVSRGEAEDASGATLEELLRAEGYDVERRIVADERGAAHVLRLAARDAVGDGEHGGVQTSSFVFSTTRTSVTTICLSIAFAMS